jgi:transposase-like protein
MSKIPQGEWNAIAARYAQGETISRIAQSYGCTPPAIHYILKRNKQRSAPNPEQTLDETPASPSSSVVKPAERQANSGPVRLSRLPSQRGPETATLNESRIAPAQPLELRPRSERENTPGGPTYRDRDQPTFSDASSHSARNSGQATAMTAGLDNELQGRAEAAIEAFRSSFDAALAERSPVCRQKLRQAASDLMRVAARTTIVLDRLDASTEHATVRGEVYWRSEHAR